MASTTEQLLERIAAELREIRENLDRLRSQFPKHPTLTEATELHKAMDKRLADVKKKAAQEELSDSDVVELSQSIAAGMKKMLGLVASDQADQGEPGTANSAG